MRRGHPSLRPRQHRLVGMRTTTPNAIYPSDASIPDFLEPPDDTSIRDLGDLLVSAAADDSAAGLPGLFHPPTRPLPVEEAAAAGHAGEQARLYAWAIDSAAAITARLGSLRTQLTRVTTNYTAAIDTHTARQAEVDDARARVHGLNLLEAHPRVRSMTWAVIIAATCGAAVMNKTTFQRLTLEKQGIAIAISLVAEFFVVAVASLGGRNAVEFIHGHGPTRERRARAVWALIHLILAFSVAGFLGAVRWRLSDHPAEVSDHTGIGLFLGIQFAAVAVACGHAWILGHPQITALRGAQHDLKAAHDAMIDLESTREDLEEDVATLTAYSPFAAAAVCAAAGSAYLLQQAKLGRAERERLLTSPEAQMILAALPEPEFPTRSFAAPIGTGGPVTTAPAPAWPGNNGKPWTLVI